MAVSETPRFKLPQWSEGTDPRPGRVTTNEIHEAIETQAAMFYASGPLDTRPAAGVEGRLFLATDQGEAGQLYYDQGATWVGTGSVGGGGAGLDVVPGVTATSDFEGTSSKAARADHRHALPLANSSRHGALASQHYDLLANASTSPTGNSVAVRDSGGRLNVANPTSSAHAAPKSYVDNATSGYSSATSAIVGNAIVKRWGDGSISGPYPDKPEFYTPRSYVDGKTWDGSDIVSGKLSPYRVNASWDAYHRAWPGTGTVRAVHATSDGWFCYYSSTPEHKTNMVEWDLDPDEALAVEPIEFDRLDPETGEETGIHDYGVNAWQAAEHLPMFAEHDDDGKITGWSYMRWTTAHQSLIRWLAGRVDTLEDEVETLRRQDADRAQEVAELRRELAALSGTVGDLIHIVNNMADPDLIDPDADLEDGGE